MDHLLVRAARGEMVERPPVWAMRQAGRWDPEFHKLRGGLTFFEFSENVELSTKCSLLPKRFGVDAIILFYDIT
ncbi:MAG: uroporphyrinogen decarboxylase family protein, partial [Planctomycetota bacterium]